ncbi:MAG: CHAT domain-containing protein [Leptolyngbyaceae cyanobacterium]
MNKTSWLAIATALPLLGSLHTLAWADSIVPADGSTGTQVITTGTEHTITGGSLSADHQNLFHQFTEFNLLTGESVTFVTHPDIVNVLSGVTGSNPSIIDGLLQVSGSRANLFLINPNGILLGPETALNLQGSITAVTAKQINFATSSFDLGDTSDFAALSGEPQSYGFSLGEPASLVNSGDLAVLPGQAIVLLGGQVLQTGSIAAPGGDIIISAVEGGQLVRITQSGLLLNLEIETLPELAAEPLPFSPLALPDLLTGSAIAPATEVVINPDGSVSLSGSAAPLPNTVGTTIVGGAINSSSPLIGGNITITGTTIGLLEAMVNASGNGGGTIRIGGDYQGNGPLPAANVTFDDDRSQILADAIASCYGGTIVLLSESTSGSYGRLSAQGGLTSGNGGLIETSSRGYLDTRGIPNVSAPAGQAGTWLIDPIDIEIVDDSETDFDAFPTGNPFIAQGGNPAIISWFDIQNALGQGSGVTVTVSTGTGGGQNGDITVDGFDLGAVSPDATLELLAAGDIDLPFGLTSSGGVSYEFVADADNNGSGQIVADGVLSTNGGDILLSGADAGSAPAIDLRSAVISDGGDITIRSRNGDVELLSVDAGTPLLGLGGAITIDTPDLVRVSDPIISLETSEGAPITIRHGGNGTIPFVVGNSDLNGSAGEISNGLSTAPPASYSNTSFVGAIAIETGMAPPPVDEGLDCVGNCETIPPPTEDFGDENFFEDSLRGPGLENELGDFNGDDFGEPLGFGDPGDFGEPGDFDGDFDGGDFDGPEGPPRADEEAFEEGDRADGPDDFDEDRADRPDDQRESNGDDDSRAARRREGEEDFDEGEEGPRREGDREFDDNAEDLTLDEWAFEDAFYAEDFVSYFGLSQLPEPDFATSQTTLRTLTQQVGTASALVYARFSPAGVTVAQQATHKQLQNPQPTDVLQLVLVTPDGQPQQVEIPGATRDKVINAVRQLQIELTDRTRRRQTTYLAHSQTLYKWLIEPLEKVLQAEEIGHLSLIMAPGLRSLPVAALHDGEQFIIEKYTVGLMPSLALTDTRYTDVRQAPVLAMGASEFTDQPDLPAVPFELTTIVEELRQGQQTLNETFTPQRLVAQRQAAEFPILHLATHGEFRAGGPNNSYIQFWNQRLGLDQIRELQLNNPPLELLVMSACKTALGDTSAELGFAGLAVQAGVKSALASLWQVSDLETAGLMTEFYAQLSQQPYKAEALRQAQLAMLRGEVTVTDGQLVWNGGTVPLPENLANLRFGDTRHPYYWAAFTLVGSPW